MAEPLSTWRDGAVKRSIVDFVERATTVGGPEFVAPANRIATFDNDGTLWCEKPLYVQADFVLRTWGAMAAAEGRG